eukprot:359555-Chlamydomonas_euryale.AAC.6
MTPDSVAMDVRSAEAAVHRLRTVATPMRGSWKGRLSFNAYRGGGAPPDTWQTRMFCGIRRTDDPSPPAAPPTRSAPSVAPRCPFERAESSRAS